MRKVCMIFMAGLLLAGLTADAVEGWSAEATMVPVMETTGPEVASGTAVGIREPEVAFRSFVEIMESEAEAGSFSDAVVTGTKEKPAVKRVETGAKERFRYVSKDYFYTDFEGESMVQTDVEDACTICQRDLGGELTGSYYMGKKFAEILYVDAEWLYYSDYDTVEEEEDFSESVYRIPLVRKEGKEILEISQKEYLFTEPKGLSGSAFSDNPFLQIRDDTIYYFAGGGLGTYDLKSGKRTYYPHKEVYMNAAGSRYMIAEGKNQSDVLIDLESGKREVLKTDHHPWLRLGREFYFPFPYTPFPAGGMLIDLNSGETMEVLSQREGERVAKEMGVPYDKERLASDGWEWDGVSIEYIGYYDHRVYAEIRYDVLVSDKKGREIWFEDAVCVSRNMDEEKGWTIEKEITAYARKKIMKYYKQVEEGSFKIKKDDDGEIQGCHVEIGEGIANGIFYFAGFHNKKKGEESVDIYDLKEKKLRVIDRNSPEIFYPFFDNSHEIMIHMHQWQNIRCLAPITSQGCHDANDDNRYERDRYGDALVQRDHKGKIVKTIPMAIDEVEWVTNEWLYYTSGYDGGLWRMPIEKTKKGDSLKKKKKEKLLEEYDIDIHYATSSYLLMEIWQDQDAGGILCKYDLESGNLIVEEKKVSGDKD